MGAPRGSQPWLGFLAFPFEFHRCGSSARYIYLPPYPLPLSHFFAFMVAMSREPSTDCNPNDKRPLDDVGGGDADLQFEAGLYSKLQRDQECASGSAGLPVGLVHGGRAIQGGGAPFPRWFHLACGLGLGMGRASYAAIPEEVRS